MSHDLDMMRCTGTGGMMGRIRKLENDVGEKAAHDLVMRAASAILATGDRLYYAPTGLKYRSDYDPDVFFDCSRDAAKCWELAGGAPPPAVQSSGVPVPGELAFDGANFIYEEEFKRAAAAPLRFIGTSFKVRRRAACDCGTTTGDL